MARRGKDKPMVLKRSEIRKSVRKPPVPPGRRHEDKTRRPRRDKVREDELQ